MLDVLQGAGLDVIGVGKIFDIFAGKGLKEPLPTSGNADGMAKTDEIERQDFRGLCFVNLVDFDMLYGHRNDAPGYAAAISAFDKWLGGFLPGLKQDDVLIITADHGCDPLTESTDHSREYIPLLVYGSAVKPVDLGVRTSFADIGKTVCDLFGVKNGLAGRSFLREIGGGA
jgi:phosphopentomutase